MRKLEVNDFSCISRAELEIDKLTVIIGPQASGKSVLAKLCFFANDVIPVMHNSILKGESLEKYGQKVKDRFFEWFPTAAWGTKKFKIQYTAGDYSITITRKSYKEKVSDDIRLNLSDGFKKNYEEFLVQASKRPGRQHDPEASEDIERDWRLREIISSSHKKLQGKDAIEYQAFIPAGRSFFTSVGKAIAVFEHGRILDPLILRFGRLYSIYKDRPRRLFSETASDKEHRRTIDQIMTTLLGGTIHQDGDREYLLTPDGRRVPFTSLSSGQQELLPVISFLPWFWGSRSGSLCYIEEPEAHLFPSTQSQLVQALVMAAGTSNLVMTTHSPYVITKVNNLLKAGSLARKLAEPLRKELEALIPRKAWLSARHVNAYAIVDGKLTSILGSDGFIDADYLDQISSDLSNEFSEILDLEYRNVQ